MALCDNKSPQARLGPALCRGHLPSLPVSSASLPQVAQHAMEDAAVLEVADLVGRVDPDRGLEGDVVGAIPAGGDVDLLRLAVLQIPDLEGLLAREAQRVDRLALGELKRITPIPIRLER